MNANKVAWAIGGCIFSGTAIGYLIDRNNYYYFKERDENSITTPISPYRGEMTRLIFIIANSFFGGLATVYPKIGYGTVVFAGITYFNFKLAKKLSSLSGYR